MGSTAQADTHIHDDCTSVVVRCSLAGGGVVKGELSFSLSSVVGKRLVQNSCMWHINVSFLHSDVPCSYTQDLLVPVNMHPLPDLGSSYPDPPRHILMLASI